MTNCKLLIFDDDEDLAEIFKIIFRKHYEVVSYSKINFWKKIISEEKPDLIISDLNFYGHNCIDIICDIKATHRHIPLIVLSGDADIKTLHKTCKSDAFISKPFDLKDLKSTINSFIK